MATISYLGETSQTYPQAQMPTNKVVAKEGKPRRGWGTFKAFSMTPWHFIASLIIETFLKMNVRLQCEICVISDVLFVYKVLLCCWCYQVLE